MDTVTTPPMNPAGNRARPTGRLALLFRRLETLALACAVLGIAASAQANPAKPTEYEVKGAYLYNFGKFVQWPRQARSASSNSFFICVLGQDPFGPAMDATLADEALDGKNVVVRRISDPRGGADCHVVFVSASEESRLKSILDVLDKQSVLTVSDMPQFLARGGMIQFVLAENRVRFEVNLDAAQRAGLSLSSQLLKVALTVRKGSHRRD